MLRPRRNAVADELDSITSRYPDLDQAFWPLFAQVNRYSMLSVERLSAVRDAVRYVIANGIAGDVVECGVWRGGSAMMAALAMREGGDPRPLWLYDTFEGMTEPTAVDLDHAGHSAASDLAAAERVAGEASIWCYATQDDVLANLRSVGHPEALLRPVAGEVERTIPGEVPERIAVLRLDTDWYASTRHELEHLWPRLSPGGVLLIDDYGHWQGARQAVDEFLATLAVRPLLHRTDYTGRTAIKPPGPGRVTPAEPGKPV